MGGFTSLSIGVSGLKASQNAINTTAHNLANVNTTGYVRQQAVFSDTSYQTIGKSGIFTNQVGIGVDLSEVRRIRDVLLDKAYRQENGRQAFYESQYKAIAEIEELFGELEGVTFEEHLEKLRTAVQEVVKEPLSQVHRSSLVESSVAFITRANAIYDGLVEYQNTLNKEVQNMIDKINNLGDTIYDLNKKISRVEAGDIEHANDYRDQRDNALDELSNLVKISYEEDTDGVVTVKVEGVSFITPSSIHHMGAAMLDTAKDSELITPVWPHLLDNPVYNLETPVSTKKNTDIGGLRGLLLARGNCTANYTDIPNVLDYEGGAKSQAYILALERGTHEGTIAVIDSTDAATYPAGKADPNYTAAVAAAENNGLTVLDPADYIGGKNSAAYERDLDTYRKQIEQSSIKTVMAEIDQLVNAMVTSINDILCPNTTADKIADKMNVDMNDLVGKTFTYPAGSGKTYEITENTIFFNPTEAGYGCGVNGEVQGVELFSREHTDRYIEITVPDRNGNMQTMYVYNQYNVFGNESLYTLGNMELNEDILQDYTLIALSTKDGGEDRERAEALGEAWNLAELKLTPDYNTQKSFMEYYTEFTGQVANAGNMYENMIDYQADLTKGVNDERLRLTGVSDDEELTSLIKYQAAYNASSRYITVIDEMLEHLIMRL